MSHRPRSIPSPCKKGFSLLEITAVLGITAVILGAVASSYQSRLKRAYTQRTVAEMMAIADAAVSYNSMKGMWPTEINNLSPEFLGTIVSDNPFGKPYSLVCDNGNATVASEVPAGSAGNANSGTLLELVPAGSFDLVKITKREAIGASGRLLYDKKYHYGE